jgi:hypothetical protein
MKNMVTWPILLFGILCFSLNASAQQNTPSYDADSPIHITLETGLYEPISGCSGACPAKSWTPVHEFPVGEMTRIWVKEVIENRSHRRAIRDSVRFDWLIRDSNGKEPSLTEIGCSQRCVPECPPCPLTIIKSAPPYWGSYLPDQKTERYIEITLEYKLTEPGEYSLQLTWPKFYLAPERIELVDPATGSHSALTPQESAIILNQLLNRFQNISVQSLKILAEPKSPPAPAVVKFSMFQKAKDLTGNSK